MKRAKVAAVGLCAVFFAGVVALWVRSYSVSDVVSWKVNWTPPSAAQPVPKAGPGDPLAVISSEVLVERVSPIKIPLSQIATTAPGRLLVYRQSPFS